MITIVKGNSKIITTQGAYEEQYKQLGYQIASKKKEAVKQTASLFTKKEEDKPKKEEIKEEIKEKEDLSKKFGLKKEETSKSKKGK